MHRRLNGERQNVSRHQLARARVGDTVNVKVMGNRLEEGVDGEVVSATKSFVCVQMSGLAKMCSSFKTGY